MNVLLISSRFPWPAYTGDRIRTTVWLDALRMRANITLITPAGTVPASYHQLRHVAVRRATTPLLRAGVMTMSRRLPFHSLISAGFDWGLALGNAEKMYGPFDHAIVILSRLDPWVREELRAEKVFLDAIDSLAASTAERARAARGACRIFWSMESARTARLERGIAERYDKVLVVTDAEASIFGGKVEIIPNGVAILPLPVEPRRWDCAFWGRLRFFANQHAAKVLIHEIWPRIRALRSGATLLIAGADAPDSIRRHHGRNGIEVRSPVDDLRSLICRARIAVFPVQFGTGQATKVLEAAEAACALVATPEAVRGLGPLAAEAVVRTSSDDLARASVDLLEESDRITSMGSRLRAAVECHYPRQRTLERLAQLVGTT